MIDASKIEPIGCLYKIKDGCGNKGYLLGTIHCVPNHLLKLNGKINYYIQKADALAVEINLSTEAFQQLKSKRFISTLRSSLSTLSKNQWQTALASARLFLPKMGYEEKIDKLNDMELLIEISKVFDESLKIKIDGYDSGIDQELIRLFTERKLPIFELEESSTHILPQKELIDLMLADLIKANSLPFFGPRKELYIQHAKLQCQQIYDSLAEKWSDGVLSELPLDDELVERNKLIAMGIVNMIRNRKISFNAVGVAHLAGEESIIKYLNDEGLTVTQKFPLIHLNALKILPPSCTQIFPELSTEDFELNPDVNFMNIISQKTSAKQFDDFLKKHQCNVKTVGNKFFLASPMHAAATEGNVALIQHIFDAAEEHCFKILNFNCKKCPTPLYWAVTAATNQSKSIEVRAACTEAVRKLIQLKAEVNIPWKKYCTALDWALTDRGSVQNLPLIRLLLLNGGKVHRELLPKDYKLIYSAITPAFERLKWLFLSKKDTGSSLNILPKYFVSDVIDHYKLIG